jgi:hypothetical protein
MRRIFPQSPCGRDYFRDALWQEDGFSAGKTEGAGSKTVDLLCITKASQSLLKSALIARLSEKAF